MISWTKVQLRPLDATKKLDADTFAALLTEASQEYYNGSPVISDTVYDILYASFKERFPKHPYTHHVGAPAPLAHNKVKLPYFMGSLDKIRDDPAAMTKFAQKYPGTYVVTDKLDGNSALLTLSSAQTWQLYSRGDGMEGQNLEHAIPYVAATSLPKKLSNLPNKLAVRGELIMTKADWEARKHKGANMRNVVAGALHAIKSVDPEVAEAIHFVAYELLHPAPATPEEGLATLKMMGFIVPYQLVLKEAQLTATTLSDHLLDRRAHAPYEVDGIVVAHNAAHKRPSSGNPKYAFAFKTMLTHEQAEVTVTRVEWNVSKDKYMKPIIHFQPVTLAGAQIQKATGFHARFIEDNKIGPGARLIIVRSGDVIPHVHQVLKGTTPQFPDTGYTWNATRTDILYAANTGAAADTVIDRDLAIKRLTHFVVTLKVRGLAEKTVTKLYDAGYETPEAILHATRKQLQAALSPKIGEKIHEELERVKAEATLVDYAVASNCFGRGFSHKRLELIFKSAALDNITRAHLLALEGIADTTATQFMNALPECKAFLSKVLPVAQAEPKKVAAPPVAAGPPLDIHVVFTGFRDKDLEAEVVARGGKVGTSVSGKTTHLIAKDCSKATGKIKAAMDKGITCMSREEFVKFII